MAGDWIKMRHVLPNEPEVVGISHRLKLDRRHVVGCLHLVWALADNHALSRLCPGNSGTNEGHLSRYCPDDIDRIAGEPGFGAAMQEVGWLLVYPDGVSIPDWDSHHSNSAKERACAQKKKRNQRRNVPAQSGQMSPQVGDKTGTVEKRREEKTEETDRQGRGIATRAEREDAMAAVDLVMGRKLSVSEEAIVFEWLSSFDPQIHNIHGESVSGTALAAKALRALAAAGGSQSVRGMKTYAGNIIADCIAGSRWPDEVPAAAPRVNGSSAAPDLKAIIADAQRKTAQAHKTGAVHATE